MKKSESKEWKFKVVEVDVPESEMSDFDLEQWLADLLVDCWNRYKPTKPHISLSSYCIV